MVISNATLAWEVDEEKPSGKAKKKGEMNPLNKVKKDYEETKEYTKRSTEEGTFVNTLFDVDLTVSR